MAGDDANSQGPDLAQGVPISDLPPSGLLQGHVGEEAVLLARSGDEFFAVAPNCTHYHGPLAEGLIAGETVRCPWHHACFSLRTGEAVRTPAFDPLPCWSTERRGDTIFVLGRRDQSARPAAATAIAVGGARPGRVVIVGGGAAGFAAADMLRRCAFDGSIVMLSDDSAPPVDRPNLSKDYLAGSAQEDWVPLKPPSWYDEHRIDLRLGAKVVDLDVGAREVATASGERIPYDRLLLATGAAPVRLDVPGADQGHVHLLRSFDHCRALITAAQSSRRTVVIGASFIGLEVAASLRARGNDVHVVAPDARPLERVFGPEIGDFVRGLHEEHGVVFHLRESIGAIEPGRVVLKSGQKLDADLVVAGIGVRPRVDVAEKAGLRLDRGVAVNANLETSAPGVFAAGDIARWPDPHSGDNIRVEHWVVAQRQGQCAARNMLGAREPFDKVPFFWSQHYDVPINYVGHAAAWDK